MLKCFSASPSYSTKLVHPWDVTLTTSQSIPSSSQHTAFHHTSHSLRTENLGLEPVVQRMNGVLGQDRWRDDEGMRKWLNMRKTGLNCIYYQINTKNMTNVFYILKNRVSKWTVPRDNSLLWPTCGMACRRFCLEESPSVVLNGVWINGPHIPPLAKQGIVTCK